jgi:hypothetical protein
MGIQVFYAPVAVAIIGRRPLAISRRGVTVPAL